MKRLFLLALLAIGIVLPVSAAPAPEWTIDGAHSSVGFSVGHLFSQTTGTFDEVSGTIRFDRANLAGSGIEVVIAVGSINTRNDRRDAHLKNEDFFSADRYPSMRFVSDTIVARGGNDFTARGRLTIRDVTRPVNLDFTLHGIGDHPMRADHLVAGASARTKISRTAFGVGNGSFAATTVVGDEVAIAIEIEATRPKPAAAAAAAPRPAAGRPASRPAASNEHPSDHPSGEHPAR